MSGNAINFPPGVQRLESIFWGWDGKTKRLVHQMKVFIPNCGFDLHWKNLKVQISHDLMAETGR